jgi:hypothetical protein
MQKRLKTAQNVHLSNLSSPIASCSCLLHTLKLQEPKPETQAETKQERPTKPYAGQEQRGQDVQVHSGRLEKNSLPTPLQLAGRLFTMAHSGPLMTSTVTSICKCMVTDMGLCDCF